MHEHFNTQNLNGVRSSIDCQQDTQYLLLEVQVAHVIQTDQMDHQLLALLSIQVFQVSPLAHHSLDHPSALQVQEVLRNHHDPK